MRKNKLFVVLMAVIVMLASCDLAMSGIPVTDVVYYDEPSTDIPSDDSQDDPVITVPEEEVVAASLDLYQIFKDIAKVSSLGEGPLTVKLPIWSDVEKNREEGKMSEIVFHFDGFEYDGGKLYGDIIAEFSSIETGGSEAFRAFDKYTISTDESEPLRIINGSDQYEVHLTKLSGVCEVDYGKLNNSEAEPIEITSVNSVSYPTSGQYKVGDVIVEAEDLNGNGSAEKPFIVRDANGLVALLSQANSSNGYGKGVHILLTEDISLAEYEIREIDVERFAGVLDGGGHTLSDINIQNTDSGFTSLIKDLSADGVIRNLNIEDLVITRSASGAKDIGLVGVNNGTIENVHVLSGSMIVSSGRCGVLVGTNNGTIRNVSNKADAKGTGQGFQSQYYIGGIVGNSEDGSIIENAINYGNITGEGEIESIGGIVGYSYEGLTLINVENRGDVKCPNAEYAGGIIGNVTGTIQNARNYGDVEGVNAGGIVGYAYGSELIDVENHGPGDIAGDYDDCTIS